MAGIPYPATDGQQGDGNSLEEKWPHLYQELVDVRNEAAKNITKTCGIWNLPLNTANCGCCSAAAANSTARAIRMAVEMVEEGLISKEEAIIRVRCPTSDPLLHRCWIKAKKNVIATGLPASPSAAVGRAVFNAEDAEA